MFYAYKYLYKMPRSCSYFSKAFKFILISGTFHSVLFIIEIMALDMIGAIRTHRQCFFKKNDEIKSVYFLSRRIFI